MQKEIYFVQAFRRFVPAMQAGDVWLMAEDPTIQEDEEFDSDDFDDTIEEEELEEEQM